MNQPVMTLQRGSTPLLISLPHVVLLRAGLAVPGGEDRLAALDPIALGEIGRASCRERVCNGV